jgi:hypothetical protein
VRVPGEWFGEVRVVTIVGAAEHPRDDVELRDPTGGAVSASANIALIFLAVAGSRL